MPFDKKHSELDEVTTFFLDFCRDAGLTVLTSGVEKHGSWDWSASYPSGEFHRALSLALTGTSDTPSYRAEIWLDAERDSVAFRTLIEVHQISRADIKNHARRTFEPMLHNAFKRLVNLTTESLTSFEHQYLLTAHPHH
jgi:hypothetical protein